MTRHLVLFCFLCMASVHVYAAEHSQLLMENMSWNEIKNKIDEGADTVIFAVGSTEQHGTHLPISVDQAIGSYLVRQLAKELGTTLVAPGIQVGASHHNLSFPGTLVVRESVLEGLLRDYVFSLAWHGFRHIIILPTQYENYSVVGRITTQLSSLYPHLDIIGVSDAQEILDTLHRTSKRLGVADEYVDYHAGLSETAMLLAIDPTLSDMRHTESGHVGQGSAFQAKLKFEGMSAISENGVIGDPRLATPELGNEYLDDLSDFLFAKVQKARSDWQFPTISPNLEPMRLIEPTGPLAKGIRFRRTGEYEKAISFFDEKLKESPEDAFATVEMAKTLMVWGKYSDARTTLTPLLENSDSEVRYMANDKLGEIALVQGRFRQAVEHKDVARKLSEAANDPIGQARKLMWMGWIQAQTSQFEAADKTLERALMLVPSLYDTRRPESRDEAVISGVSSIAGGGTDTFLDLKQVAVQMHVKRGTLIEAARNLRDLEEGAINFPSSARRFRRMHGMILLARGRHDDALVNLSMALTEIDYPEYQGSLGRAYLAAGNLVQAEARFLRLINLKGDSKLHTPDEYVVGYFWLGQVYDKMGREEEAKSMYRKFLTFWGEADIQLAEIVEAKNRLH